MKATVFIDGSEGTTGLQIRRRLANHGGVEVLDIAHEHRKDEAERARLMNAADAVFLCLPDSAAVEAVKLVTNPNTVVIDASTAHRTNPEFAYGFAELSPSHRAAIAKSKRIANPGCHATGFIAAVYPLTALGIIEKTALLSCFSITGYSGGGKKMIAAYEDGARPREYDAPRSYGLAQSHKHIPEMCAVTKLDTAPVFSPVVCDYYEGMAVTVPLHASVLKGVKGVDALYDALHEHYGHERFVSVRRCPESGFIPSNDMTGSCGLVLYVAGNDERMTLTSTFDNLGKGASGAAVQNMNIALGFDEGMGVEL